MRWTNECDLRYLLLSQVGGPRRQGELQCWPDSDAASLLDTQFLPVTVSIQITLVPIIPMPVLVNLRADFYY